MTTLFAPRTEYRLCKVISGGQTGADQGGLLAAHKLGLATGGTCPDNWMTSRGSNPLLKAFGLTARGSLDSRTKQNIKDADGTILLWEDGTSPGTVLTRATCTVLSKPLIEVDLKKFASSNDPFALILPVVQFLKHHRIKVLNVAGNRERHSNNQITELTEFVLESVFQQLDLEDMLLRDSDL